MGEILGRASPAAQIAAFADRFQDRYFPLDDHFRTGDVEGYGDLTIGIPVRVRGLSWEDYHYIAEDWRLGLQLLTYLVVDPCDEDGGARLALAEWLEEDPPARLGELLDFLERRGQDASH